MRAVFRSLLRTPSFALGAMATLALGIGTVAASVAAARGVLLTPLPHRDESRLMYLRQSARGVGIDNALFSVPEIQVYRRDVPSFEGVAEFSAMRMTALGLDRPRQVYTGVVSGNYFEVLGLGPTLGRTLDAGDDGDAAAPVAVLTPEYWRSAFGGAPDVVGTTMRMNGRTVTIVGIAQPHPPYPERTDLLVNMAVSPHHLSATMVHGWSHRMTEVFARLAPGSTRERASAEVATAFARLRAEHPEAYSESAEYAVRLGTLRDQLTHRARTTLLLALATAGCVLLIALANVASLILARATRLSDELAMRGLLGAGTPALRTRLLAENLLVGVSGAVLGLGLARAELSLVVAFLARLTTRASQIHLDGWTLLLAVALAVGSGVVLAFIPRLPDATDPAAFRSVGRGSVGSGARLGHRALVVVQVAVSFVLVFGGGLLARTSINLQSIDPGLDVQHVLAMDVPAVYNGRSRDEIRDDYLEMVAAVEKLPGVVRAAVTNVVPFKVGSSILPFRFDFLLDDAEPEAGGRAQRADFRTVSDGFFQTLGVEIVAGRDLAAGDDAGAAGVAVVNEAFVRAYLPRGDVIGHHLAWSGDAVRYAGISGEERTIVGVAADVIADEEETTAYPTVYLPHLQEAWGSALVIRGRGDVEMLETQAVRAVGDVERDQPVENVETLQDARRASFGDVRLNAELVGLLATVALLIAAVGVFATLAFSVGRRTREMGLRMALGADGARLVRRIVGEALALVGAGLCAGLVGCVALGGLLRSALYGVAPTDPLSLVAGACVLVAATLVAAFVPARRAASVDPARALASE